MAGVQFNRGDAAVLWCIPRNGCDLECLVDLYVFIERIAIPSYAEIAGSLSRAIRAGIMVPPLAGHLQLTTEWYGLFHQFDSMYAASELGMVEFADILISQEWLEASDFEYTLSPTEFDRAVQSVQKHLDQVFKR